MLRPIPAVIVAVLAVISLSACDAREHDLGSTPDQPTTLVLATGYTGSPDQTSALQRAVDDLREQTGSGWIGRQDEVTGMLGDLSGGRWFADPGADAPAVVRAFLDTWGTRLFGVGSADVVLDAATPPTDAGSTTIRALQQAGGVPVLDGQLVVTVGAADDDPRVNAVRGRVFGGLKVDTTPTLHRTQAVARAERISGGTSVARPQLLVVPTDTGHLTWRVTITQTKGSDLAAARQDGYYFIDAQTGRLVTVRAASAEGLTPVHLVSGTARTTSGLAGVHATSPARRALRLGADPNSVDVSGTDPVGNQLTAHGVRTGDGVALVDTTVPTYDAASRQGAIRTFDMGGSDDDSALPGRLYFEPGGGTTITDPDAIAAQAFSRKVYDYYGSLGWASWDGHGGTLDSSVHFGDNTMCNAFFNGEQMVYGNPCAPDGTPFNTTFLDLDVAAHEITHGVTGSSAGLIYSGQSGAMNESFSDYFGNLIGDDFYGADSTALGERICLGIDQDTPLCTSNPDGTRSTRFLLNGVTFDDYWYALDTTTERLTRFYDDQDHGGVHINSAIWNNALWSIRSRLAQMDDTSMLESGLAHDFDKIVFHALTTQLGPTAGFLDGRAAIEQTTIDAGADPVILRVEREVFDSNDICAGCGAPAQVAGQVVTRANETEMLPAVHGDRIAWLARGDNGLGTLATGAAGAQATAVAGSAGGGAQAVFAGDALVGLEYPDGTYSGQVVMIGDGAAQKQIGSADYLTAFAGLAGSDDGAAWEDNDALYFVDPSGAVTSTPLPDLGGDTPITLATGNGVVAFGTDGGGVYTWTPGGDITQLGSVPGKVLSIACSGDRVLAIGSKNDAGLFVPGRDAVQVSDKAMPFGAAMNDHYAVWADAVGDLKGRAAEEAGADYYDTDLYLVSLDTGKVYSLMQTRGQQGFPALSGDRLVWQDTVYGGNDILTATIPSGL